VALLPFAVFFGKIKKKKVIYEAVEFYISQSFAALPGTLGFIKKIAIYLEGLLVRQVDGVICIPSITNKLYSTYSKNNRNVQVIMNVPTVESTIDQDLYKVLNTRYTNKNVLVYAGAISIEKGVMNVVMSMVSAVQYHPDIMLVLIGGAVGDDTGIINDYIVENNLRDHIDIIEFQPYDMLFTYYCVADIGIGLIEKRLAKKFTKGGSRKIMEYMKASLALLVTDDSDIGLIAKEEECGILVDMWDVEAIANKIIWMFNHPLRIKEMAENGNRAFQHKYNWNKESQKFLEIYNIL
jgi:glycosyltransferase involved in cell wall biosynthesis